MLRASLNVPITNGRVGESFRIGHALSTIEHLRRRGARTVVISHIGSDQTRSLSPVAEYLKNKIPLTFVDDIVGAHARDAVHGMKDGDVVLLENVRRNVGEMDNDEHFARQLASLAHVYVNDDFASAHRKHASIVSLPALMPGYGGLTFMHELAHLAAARTPASPSLAIIGGAKFLTKEPVIKALLETYDTVYVCGALANDFLRARGMPVGKSLVSNASIDAKILHHPRIQLPVDVTVKIDGGRAVRDVADTEAGDYIADIGPKSLSALAQLVTGAKTVLWNGPLGNFEMGFAEMTEAVAKLIAESPGTSVVGGGDTIASIQKLGLNNKFEFLSTAGGAMLDYMAYGTLPGIEALEKSARL
jgi:phosphoglycerate kinase